MSPVLMTGILAITTVMIFCNAPAETPTSNNTEYTEKEPTRASSLPADYIATGGYHIGPKVLV
jgi:hypothetical protein